MGKWVIKHHTDLSLVELYEILRLRNEVYIVELETSVQDVDGMDLTGETYHLMNVNEADNHLNCYLRIHKIGNEEAKIRRVVTAKAQRGKGLATLMMQRAIDWCQSEGLKRINIAARIHLQKFYESIGFKAVSEKYYIKEVKVWHVDMVLNLDEL